MSLSGLVALWVIYVLKSSLALHSLEHWWTQYGQLEKVDQYQPDTDMSLFISETGAYITHNATKPLKQFII